MDDNTVFFSADLAGQWIDCPEKAEQEPLMDATFALVMAPKSTYFRSSDVFTRRLVKVIRQGAIPVILGELDFNENQSSDTRSRLIRRIINLILPLDSNQSIPPNRPPGTDVELPFSQQLEWEKAAVILLKARAPELHLILRTYSDADIVALRRQGRRLMEAYLGSPKLSLDTLLTAIRFALKMPAPPEKDEPSNPVANLSFGPVNQQFSSETDEMLGPVETPYPSLSFQRNFSLTLNHWRGLFNADFAPHRMTPWRPDDPLLPSDAKFRGSSFGFRPIGFVRRRENTPIIVEYILCWRIRSSNRTDLVTSITDSELVVPVKSSQKLSEVTHRENSSPLLF